MNKVNKTHLSKILVLGGTGFIGRNLLDLYIKNHNASSVHVLTRSIPDELTQKNFQDAGITLCQGDVNNCNDWERLLADVDVVVDLASSFTPQVAELDITGCLNNYFCGSEQLLKTCIRNNIRLVYCSSGGSVYGYSEKRLSIDEKHTTNPVSYYGIIKLAKEKQLQLLSLREGLRYCILRVSNPYGPWQNFCKGQGLINTLIHCLMNDKEFTLYGDGSIVRDYIYIEDVVEAFNKVIDLQIDSETLNISSGEGLSISQVIAIVEEQFGEKLKIKKLTKRSFDPPFNVLNNSKACRLLDWSPKHSLEEGLSKTLKWHENRKVTISKTA